ncbi:MAG TPA: MarR family transcriptional regulator [Arenicellales bacterium]|jgi:DNA-binding MarR family transcriptional regulator|nr:MarR family transcriptional regulator [Pseudomonadales bacterium]MDP6267750.1 MarR family transcriptional regulator [Arenicellales bacterium]MDP7451958.1 MarR family transcriptional regulator [Arenicellales bacterium]HJL51051.1 MarR family transcriptional regulator [Arenicellales bacterium]HJP50238.1 MarR family transcriptional regulator [Pseudomonadales bacterium]|tara:strand:+ start:404 stop:883 length:480 start_codon:yes stop_codon:yes gene_type:complete
MASNTKVCRSTSPNYPFELGQLEEILGYYLRRAQSANFQLFDKHLNGRNISPGQFGLLCKISNNPGINQTVLARADGIERSTLGEIIDRLEARKLVERRRDPADRRVYALHLTKKGEKFLAQITPEVLAAENELTRNLTQREFKTLLTLIKKLVSKHTN